MAINERRGDSAVKENPFTQKNEGEGSPSSAKNYREGVESYKHSHDVDADADAAVKDLDDDDTDVQGKNFKKRGESDAKGKTRGTDSKGVKKFNPDESDTDVGGMAGQKNQPKKPETEIPPPKGPMSRDSDSKKSPRL